jgi:hypothetical protein
MPENMRPTHRRSETGKIEDHWSESVSMPPDIYFDDAPAPEPEPESSDVDRLRVFIAILKDGRRHTMPARLAAWEYVFRMNGRTMREAAQGAGCELKTFFEAVRKIQRLCLSKSEPTTTSRPL